MKTEVWFIDDDGDNRAQFEEHYGGRYDVEAFDSPLDAFNCTGSPDVFLIDCSAVGSLRMPQLMYAPICSLITKHPEARYLLRSAMPVEFTQNVVDDVKRECPEARIRAIDWGDDPERLFVRRKAR